MIETVCKHVINAGTEMSECNCYRDNKCDYQEPDYNLDGTINVVTCRKYLPPEIPISYNPEHTGAITAEQFEAIWKDESEVQDDDER